MKTCSENMES